MYIYNALSKKKTQQIRICKFEERWRERDKTLSSHSHVCNANKKKIINLKKDLGFRVYFLFFTFYSLVFITKVCDYFTVLSAFVFIIVSTVTFLYSWLAPFLLSIQINKQTFDPHVLWTIKFTYWTTHAHKEARWCS
jgi:hypothetical protein